MFVLERVDTMNDEVANRLLKTLEEPAAFVHLILLTDALGQVIPTVVSRCQLVRFDPLPPARIAARLEAEEGVPAERAAACARLALGNGDRARFLASEEGEALRADVDRMMAAALSRRSARRRRAGAWRGLLERAKERREAAEERVGEARRPAGDRAQGPRPRRAGAAVRGDREARRPPRATELLDLGLTLAALGFRDLVCVAEGAEDAALDPERAAGAQPPAPARATRAGCARRPSTARTRGMSLEVNVTEDLALEALGFRLSALVGSA